ncbi:uncharacterized protein [Diadema antillarum]|uniref:uncharacterized protein n=1 Tax=Diadema antillarum TaxID=105358 RepID=UPI003A88E171
MPLIKREVEPVFVSQLDIGKDIDNELECVSNYTLASIIRQLGNLSKHAEDIFGDLFQESMAISTRAGNIQNRMDAISRAVSQMDPLKDTVSMRDINTRINFKSGLIMDTKVVSSPTMPSAMKETYERCQKPPPLNLLSKYREDDKDAMKFYTDPKFFFERWLTEQKKDIMKKKKKRMKRPVSNIGKGPTKVVKTRKAGKGRGKELDDIDRERQERPKSTRRRQTSQGTTGNHEEQAGQEQQDASKPLENGEIAERPLEEDPLPPPPQLPIGDGGDFSAPSSPMEAFPGELPMPPPPPSEDLLPPPPSDPSDALYSDMDSLMDDAQAFPQPPSSSLPGNVPPPPPPPPNLPPPNQRAGPAPPAPPPIPAFIPNPLHIDRTSKIPEPITVVQDTRDDILSAIRQGMKLRKVDVNVEKQRAAEPEANSVEAILRRRIAMEVSSDEETSSTFSSDDSAWEDEDD